jgi:hypothetical protein
MRTIIASLALAVSSLALMSPAVSTSDPIPDLAGVWQLVSFQNDFQDGRPSTAPLGQHAKGYLIFTPGGRMMGLLEAEGRHPALTDHDSANLLMSMTAYTGTYAVTGDKWVTRVNAAWNPAWDGTRQAREFSLMGDRLIITTPWLASPHITGSPIVRERLVFQRVETMTAR